MCIVNVEDTWHLREMPVLLAIHDAEREHRPFATPEAAERLGLPEGEVRDSMLALMDAGYVKSASVARSRAYAVIAAPRLTERGRRQVGQWPDDGYSALVALLEARIATTTDEIERGRLQTFLGGLVGVGRDVATDLLSALLRDLTGLR